MSRLVTLQVEVIDGFAETLVATARAAAAAHTENPDIVALAVRYMAEDAAMRLDPAVDSTVRLEIDIDGTELAVNVTDRGEPVAGPLESVLVLADNGSITSITGHIENLANRRSFHIPLPVHSQTIDTESVDGNFDEFIVDDPVAIRVVRPEDAESLVRCIYRTYGWTYAAFDMYYPSRVASMYASGKRMGLGAFTDDGELVAHMGFKRITEGLIEAGAAVTDPRFRRRGLLTELASRISELTSPLDLNGSMGQPVLTHTATQSMSLRSGSQLMGFNLLATPPFRQAGITSGDSDTRQSFAVTYRRIKPLEAASLFVPSPYAEILRKVLEPTGWPRTLEQSSPARDENPVTRHVSSFDSEISVGDVVVDQVGVDLIDVVDDHIQRFRRAGAAMTRVVLPANQPLLWSCGTGLAELGLVYSHFLPQYGDLGDVLVLQWLGEFELDTSQWQLLEGPITELAATITAHVHSIGSAGGRLRRREARRQQLLARLPGTA